MSRAIPCPFCKAGHLRQTQWFRTLQCDACGTGTAQRDGPGRIGCLVPFCRSTRGDWKGDEPLHDGVEWMCWKHYRLVPRSVRRRRTRLDRMSTRADEAQRNRIRTLQRRLWARAKASAIEAAGGLS